MPLIVSHGGGDCEYDRQLVSDYGNLGRPRLEVVGAAIATVMARGLEIAAFVFVLQKRKPGFPSFKIKAIFKIDASSWAECCPARR